VDLFKFVPGADPTVLIEGAAINGTTSVMWTERYRDPGEFEIVAPVSSNLHKFLPVGTIISHTNTLDAMIVENHNIKDDEEKDPIIQITGRSLDAILEDRIVGSNLVQASNLISEYILSATNSWAQAVTMINDHIQTPTDSNDRLPNFYADTSMTGSGTSEARSMDKVTVHAAIMSLLAVDNLGIRVLRRNPFGKEGANDRTLFRIHNGVDRTANVIFSKKAGDLESSEYLWTNRKYVNSVIVAGRYVNVKVHTAGLTGYNRSMGVVEADDIDGHLDTVPSGATLTAIVAKMQTRGRAAMVQQNRINLIRADLSEMYRFQYRRDYNIGDIVTIDGNYEEITPMRVVEYVEIQDENEEKGHPTLETPNPEP
jgi:Siphovirus ReqiPepy6 Gp37-like protein